MVMKLRASCRGNEILHLLSRHRPVHYERYQSKSNAKESEEVGQDVGYEETVGFVIVAVDSVREFDGSVDSVTRNKFSNEISQ
jgi:hypothetical protein